MKVIEQGTPQPKYRWMRHQWRCSGCESVVMFEEADAKAINYKSEQRDGEWIDTRCPVCESKQTFYPVKER